MSQPLVHVCLVSAQVLPNLIPALMHRPAAVHMVVSPDMTVQANRFGHVLRVQNIPAYQHEQAPSTGLPGLLDYATRVAERIDQAHPGGRVVLNATGGTKLMAMAFVEVFRDLLGAAVLYTDTQHGLLEYLAPRGISAEPMTRVLDVRNYLAAQGLLVRRAASDSPTWLDLANRRKPLTKRLAREGVRLGRVLLGVLNGLVRNALDDQGSALATPTQTLPEIPGPDIGGFLRQMVEHGLLRWDGHSSIEFLDVASARYLGGGWLEEYAWHIVADERPDDVCCGVVADWDTSMQISAGNEFDLLAVHRNRMLVVECKTLRFGRDPSSDADIFYKLESLGRNAGGLFAHPLLLSARPLGDRERARASAQHIDCIESAQLPLLRERVRAWMRGQ